MPEVKPLGRVAHRWEHLRYIHVVIGLILVVTLVFAFRYTLFDSLGIVQYRNVKPMKITVYSSVRERTRIMNAVLENGDHLHL